MFFLQLFAKLIAKISQVFLSRPGSTWPGEIALRLYPKIAKLLRRYFREVIIVMGTNGKTSTSKFLVTALKNSGRKVISNPSGANLLNGLVSTVLTKLPLLAQKQQYTAVIEVDEYAFGEIARQFHPDYVIILNLFRDQLDRYGEVGNILARWQKALILLPETKVLYPTVDPGLQSLFVQAKNKHWSYAIPDELLSSKPKIAGDYIYCQQCGHKLVYQGYYLGHLGKWHCPSCQFAPDSRAFSFNQTQLKKLQNLPDYMQINLQAAFILLKKLNIAEDLFWQTVANWQPAFGRGEKYENKTSQYTFYLGKNPASWSAALNDIVKQGLDGAELILGLNNRVPDGHDISWIYDADFSSLNKKIKLSVFGDRATDLAVRLKINHTPVHEIFVNLSQLKKYIEEKRASRIILLANYSALLEVRRLIIGRSLL